MFRCLLQGRTDGLRLRTPLYKGNEADIPNKFVPARRDLEERSISTVNTEHARYETEIETIYSPKYLSFAPSRGHECKGSNASDSARASSILEVACTASITEVPVESSTEPAGEFALDFTVNTGAMSDMVRHNLQNSPFTAGFKSIDLTDTIRYRVPTHDQVMEFNQLRQMPATPGTPVIVITSLEMSPRGGARRVRVISTGHVSLKVGQIIHSYGTLSGYWVLSAQRFREGSGLYVKWVNYINAETVVVCMPGWLYRYHVSDAGVGGVFVPCY